MIVSTDAIVISKVKYRDHDLIVKCYTKDFGVKSYLLRGALKKSKGNRFSVAYFQLFSILSLEADHRDERSLQYIKEVRPKANLMSFQQDVIKSSIIIFLSEILSGTLTEAHEDAAFYAFLETSIHNLDTLDKPASFHLNFLMELTRHLGFYPSLDHSNRKYFNLLEGKFQDVETNPYCLSGKILTAFKTLLGTKFDVTKNLNVALNEKRELLNMILVYFRLHLHGFKEPKSLAVLNQVFS